jgi:uncharacterized glyoxalase superfamily protein PhnB
MPSSYDVLAAVDVPPGLWFEDADATYRRAVSAGATARSAPDDKPYEHRVVDVNGITWWLAAPVR